MHMKRIDARALQSEMNYIGMEKAARKLLIDEQLAKAEEVAVMTCVEVCEKLLATYNVVCNDEENIAIVKKQDMKTYNNIVKYLSR